MMITKQAVADKIAAYLHHEISLVQLVDWAESAVMDAEFPERDAKTLSSVVARLGVADVRAFGLAWEGSASSEPTFSVKTEARTIDRGSQERKRTTPVGFAPSKPPQFL